MNYQCYVEGGEIRRRELHAKYLCLLAMICDTHNSFPSIQQKHKMLILLLQKYAKWLLCFGYSFIKTQREHYYDVT